MAKVRLCILAARCGSVWLVPQVTYKLAEGWPEVCCVHKVHECEDIQTVVREVCVGEFVTLVVWVVVACGCP